MASRLSFLGVILSHTERINVAPGIASIFTRTPAFMSMSAASLHTVAPSRTILGVGVSTRLVLICRLLCHLRLTLRYLPIGV